MATVRNPFMRLSKGGVIGTLQATGTRDPDALREIKRGLIRSLRYPQLVGVLLLGLGGMVAFLVQRVLPGLPLMMFGWWLWYRGARNIAAVEAGYAEFVKSPAS